MSTSVSIEHERLAQFCRQHHIRRLALFGSRLSGNARPDSDVDLLVQFDPGEEPGLIALSAMAEELSELYGGRTVDLRTPNDLSRHFREEVLRVAEVQYSD
jgi:uncharacterized protein